MVTIADEKINSARQNLDNLIQDLKEFCIEEPRGYEEWNWEFRIDATKSLFELLEIKRKLNR